MTGRRIVIAGAGGFIGTYHAYRFRETGGQIVTIGRSGADAGWSDAKSIVELIDGADILINLAGKSVNCRCNAENMAAIFSSRIETTAALGAAVRAAKHPPKLWLNAITATIYRHADDGLQTDEDDELGSSFSVKVATSWAQGFFANARSGVRQVALRMTIVLGNGSALAPLMMLTRLGFGGPQFGGRTSGARQRFSWVHIDDVYRAIDFVAADARLSGTVNLSSPIPVANREPMPTLRRVLGAKVGIPVFEWMLKLGAAAIGTETELLLKSRWVVPSRLLAECFVFEFPLLESALRGITGRG